MRAVQIEKKCDQRAARQQELDGQVGAERAAGCDYLQCKRLHGVCPVVLVNQASGFRMWNRRGLRNSSVPLQTLGVEQEHLDVIRMGGELLPVGCAGAPALGHECRVDVRE